MDKRIIAVWLPRFATDRLTRPGKPMAAFAAAPLALVTRAQGGVRVAACNAAAEAAGVVRGLPAADAQAVCPGLKTLAAEAQATAAALSALAAWCRRWTPWAAADGDDGIWLDVSGCAHLFGGERAMLDDVVARLAALGFAVRAGLADTPGAAWAAARFGDGPATLVPEGAGRQWLATWPVAALRLPAATTEGLARLGVRRLAELLALPRAPLAARFGEAVATRLDQLLGRAPEPLSPLAEAAPLLVRLDFAEPIARTGDVERALRRLLDMLCRRLVERGLGARRLEMGVFRVDGSAAAQAVGTAEAVRDAGHLFRLLREGLDGLDAGFGIEAMTLHAARAEVFAARQAELDARPTGGGLALLVDRLDRRLGLGAVYRLAPRPTHVPESLPGRVPPLGRLDGAWPVRPRPVRLLPRPEAVAVDEVDGVPQVLHRHGRPLSVARADGPERIAAEWWHGAAPPSDDSLRDYWRVEDAGGRRWWLFRQGGSGRWYLHGEFG
ncbi:MAG: Y-family DNA polymerase [Actinomycetota bacterium]